MLDLKAQGAHVIVGMSGGVDSSVAALLLKQKGYRVSGIFMQNWEDDDEHCTARKDYRDAASVASLLDIPLSTVNFAEEYWERVFEHFLSEYRVGRTPNPDILCNKEIKFKAFLDYARQQGADAIATGHYVRTAADDSHSVDSSSASQAQQVSLLRGNDENKDQSYFLHTLNQQQLDNSLFPIGDMIKQDVREMARRAGFLVHGKKDSTGICFIGERKFNTFLNEYLPAQPGEIVTDDGKRVGRHNGLMFYTLGQRQGIGIGGQVNTPDAPWYVLEKNLNDNTLVVGQGHDHPALFRKTVVAHDVHWIAGQPPAPSFSCTAKIRYRQRDQAADVSVNSDQTVYARFDDAVRAATPGQSIVFYDGNKCLGGGVISDFETF